MTIAQGQDVRSLASFLGTSATLGKRTPKTHSLSPRVCERGTTIREAVSCLGQPSCGTWEVIGIKGEG
jgi:hypothetical protein